MLVIFVRGKHRRLEILIKFVLPPSNNMSYFWDSPPLPPQPLPESFSDIKEELLDALCSLSEEG